MIKLKFSKRYLFLPVVLLVFFVLFYLVYEDIKERTISEFNNEQLILAGTAAQGITSFFRDYQSDLTFLAQLNDIIDFNDKGKALIAGFHINHKNYIEAVTRVDAHGEILYTCPSNESIIGKNISYQKHIQQIMINHQPVISDVFLSAQGYYAIALHVPIFRGKEYAGSLAMLISIDKLGKIYLGKTRIRGTGHIWLLSENGIEIYCPVEGHTGKLFLDNSQHDSSAYKLLEKVKVKIKGDVESIHIGERVEGKMQFKEKYVVFYRTSLGNTYWTILISYQEEDVYFSLARLRNRLILIFVFLFMVISYYFYSLSKVRTVLKEEAKRKKAEKTLRESEEKFRTIFEESPIGIELYNADGLQVNANRASLDMFGIPDFSEVQKFNLFDGTSLDEEKKEKLRNGQPVAYQSFFNFEKVKELRQYKTLKNGKANFDYIITPLSNSERKTIDGYLLQVQDITERKRNEEELIKARDKAEESDRLKSAFLANMSHEIRTPMSGILGFAELLKEPGLSGDEQDKYIGIIQKSGNRLLNIINEIVDISKIESGAMKLTLSETNINEQLDFIYNFFKPEVEAKRIAFFCHCPLPIEEASIITDREKVFAILTNLVKNAIKYTREGSISLGYKKIGSELEFFVKDTGIGIPIEKQEAIFERFIQADVSDRMAMEGAGLGLAITRAYVEMLGGRISLESEEGKGSVFVFTIPESEAMFKDEKRFKKNPEVKGYEVDLNKP